MKKLNPSCIHYDIIPNPYDPEDVHWTIRLKESKWDGLLYKYNVVSLGDAALNKKGNPSLKFSYEILEIPPNVTDGEDDIEFINLIGNILVEIIGNELERREEEVNDGSRRVSYSKKSDAQRILYEESDPLS